ncbi:MAG: hypothetical protein IPI46_13775 [Bacteroidetes bacterium]|nr:hypothetical protein [Bacteroidota bacterium]
METKKVQVENHVQYVEQMVSEKKFNRELKLFKENYNDQYRTRGIILIEACFPNIELMFITPNLKPISIAFAVRINFSNYDVEPLSIRFINPITREFILGENNVVPFFIKVGALPNGQPIPQNLLQCESPNSLPFLCFQGTREYHNHSYHSGDSWLLYRQKGKGTLAFIIEALYNYGVTSLDAYSIQFISSPVLQFHIDMNKIPE